MVTKRWILLMAPFFLVSDPLSEKLKIFWVRPNFQHQLIWPKLLYFGKLEDSGNDVGDFFAHKVMQIPNLETVFESEQI